MKKLRLFSLLILLVCGFAPTQSRAQTNELAAVTGTILTEQGTPLAGASMAAIHLPTGVRRIALTDALGHFDLNTLLTGGPYVLQITQAGFRSQVVSNMFLKAGQPVNLNFALVPDVVAVGTRRADRTEQDAVAPVDVIDMRELALTAPRTDNTQLLNYVVPSFNSNRETSADGGDHVDGFNLRGLGIDQVLVLVNGHRRHASGLINLLGSRGLGSSPTDLNTISANALDRAEILRDGAAAQYGSDAIAGVMNFTLKNDNHGGNVLVNNGIHSSGLGYNTTLSLNKGLKLGKQGFLNLTGEADYRGYTTSPQYSRDLKSWPIFSDEKAREDSFLLANRKTSLDYRQRNGDARMLNYRGVYNAGVQLSEKTRFYSFGTYNFRRGQAVAPWVLPYSNPADLSDRAGFSLGYQPNINTRINDGSAVAGLELKLGQWSLDLSQSAAANRMLYDLSNTLNPSLGTASPTTFKAGGQRLTQFVTNATFTRLFDKMLAGTNVALGGEFRTDGYKIIAGEDASWKDYERGAAGASGGSQGFIGFDPTSAASGTGSRRNVAGFLDVEADVTKRWTVDGAVRFENYSDFGSAFIYKANTRLRLADWLALRGGYNTGFRAPSQAQQVYSQLTLLPTANGTTYSGIFNNQSSIAKVAGIGRLKAETSRNLSAGFVVNPTQELSLAIDAYRIDIDDRISLTNTFAEGISTSLDAALQQANTTSVQFFANSVNTRTRGLDVVTRYSKLLGRGTLRTALAANFNETRLRSLQVPALFQGIQNDKLAGNDFIGQRELSLLTMGSPRSKMIATLGYEGNKLGGQVRATRFGQVSFYDFNFNGLEEGSSYLIFRPKTSIDLLLTYKATKGLLLAAGAQNVFSVRPDDINTAADNGHAPDGVPAPHNRSRTAANAYLSDKYGYNISLPYDHDILPYQMVQTGLNGAFFYLKASYTFGL
ncbi:iron complex outermembrane recepter protein [Hymenobacter daecheongensis DSM 21074]|uniref:Iron complex outermembrane recepter protein n=1 Tax=Hymenobacter daecheongensis DSM 21074 TaxID=1121955 RepID=A0A1M6GRH4_9BACT|nr:TonB-dependent receptor [Hymenobacter daecheongensis]SHJ12557.1 iron complex outermembrane recepter protein [Hymenobacter daecheongensis DSM 21074]